MRPVNLEKEFAAIEHYWSPRVAGELNGQVVRLGKFLGNFVWHAHENEDELFLVIRGRIRMLFRDEEIVLNEGEFLIVPRGVEHCPVADEEAHVLLFEPAATVKTGNAPQDNLPSHISDPERTHS